MKPQTAEWNTCESAILISDNELRQEKKTCRVNRTGNEQEKTALNAKEKVLHIHTQYTTYSSTRLHELFVCE